MNLKDFMGTAALGTRLEVVDLRRDGTATGEMAPASRSHRPASS
jgi:hypothetical protein